MKKFLKKLSIWVTAMALIVASSTTAFAAEQPVNANAITSTNRLLEDTPMPYAGVIYNYANDNVYGSNVKEFTANASGKLRLGFSAIAYDGSKNSKVTVSLEVKNVLNSWVPQASYSFTANNTMNVITPNVNIKNGDRCRLIVQTTTNKRMVVAGYVGVY